MRLDDVEIGYIFQYVTYEDKKWKIRWQNHLNLSYPRFQGYQLKNICSILLYYQVDFLWNVLLLSWVSFITKEVFLIRFNRSKECLHTGLPPPYTTWLPLLLCVLPLLFCWLLLFLRILPLLLSWLPLPLCWLPLFCWLSNTSQMDGVSLGLLEVTDVSDIAGSKSSRSSWGAQQFRVISG